MMKFLLGLCVIMWSAVVWAEPLNVPIGTTDLTQNNIKIRITRIHSPNITAHGYDTFLLEVFRDNKWHQIPVENFNTMEGADCMVQDFDFYTNPFRIVRKKRDFGDSWMDVRPITLTLYELTPMGELLTIKEDTLPPACDVKGIDTRDILPH